ncbi:MAG: sigma-70 family RNA polymerase sigma factor [Selenomonadaceae bacterium]|nr:sigma-70 family RNA polymerase sigma factor [Selenomonadaceae bacterium]
MTKDYYSALAKRATTDEQAFEELYEYFFPRVYNFIYARLKNSADADDVTSITFMKMNENLERYDSSKAAFSTWLFRIATNSLIDFARRRDKSEETEWEEFFDPAAPEYQEPEAQTLAQESNNELLTALGKLNDRERRIIELKFWGDLDTRSIAEVLSMTESNVSMTESNVRVTLHRSLGKLKKILGEV